MKGVVPVVSRKAQRGKEKMKNIEKLIEVAKQHDITVTESSKIVINRGECKTYIFEKAGCNSRPSMLEYVIEEADYDELEAAFFECILPSCENEKIKAFQDDAKATLHEYLQRGEIMPSVVNTEANEEYLRDLVCRNVMDLSLVYRIVVSEEEGLDLILITKDMLEEAGLTEGQLFERAKEYVMKNMRMRSFFEILCDDNCFNEPEEILFSDIRESDPVIIVSYKEKINGGAILAMAAEDADILSGLRKEFPIVLLPSSIHEMLVYRGKDDYRKLETFSSIVEEVNTREVLPEEMLSNSVYLLNPETGKVELAIKGNPLANCIDREIA